VSLRVLEPSTRYRPIFTDGGNQPTIPEVVGECSYEIDTSAGLDRPFEYAVGIGPFGGGADRDVDRTSDHFLDI
jgi:hypothetical protein